MVERLQKPGGTRDVYPLEMLRRRYVCEVWRGVSVRHGFEEVDGPTFESSGLYAVKSGEGILGELFQAFSGKDPAEVAGVRETGRGPYAMRPEFTPTLARMYAARAKQLPKPVRWFQVGPFFRAERPQRGRLREFLQWNVDVVGEDEGRRECELLTVLVDCMRTLGFSSESVKLHTGEREAAMLTFLKYKMPAEKMFEGLRVLDGLQKRSVEELAGDFESLGQEREQAIAMLTEEFHAENPAIPWFGAEPKMSEHALQAIYGDLPDHALAAGIGDWLYSDLSIVRGLAYYTGTVFELVAAGERAVAGGGRYDGLVELMGGPATPAVGFAMGDVVLSLLLEEKGLMPGDGELAAAVDAVRGASSLRPEVFVVGNGDADCEGMVTPLVAGLRRGVESGAWLEREGRKPWDVDRYGGEGGVWPLHVRVTSKSTRNMKKLKGEASRVGARFFCEVHGADKVELTDLDTGEALTPEAVGDRGSASFGVDVGGGAYVGRGLGVLLGKTMKGGA